MRKELQDITIQARTYKKTDNILFVISRNINKNILCFEGDLVHGCKDPYWIMNEHTPIDIESLTTIEKKMAFGLKLMDHDDTSWTYILKALPDRPIVFTKDMKAYTTIHNKADEIESIYIDITKSLGLIPKVNYVYIYGKNSKEKIFKK